MYCPCLLRRWLFSVVEKQSFQLGKAAYFSLFTHQSLHLRYRYVFLWKSMKVWKSGKESVKSSFHWKFPKIYLAHNVLIPGSFLLRDLRWNPLCGPHAWGGRISPFPTAYERWLAGVTYHSLVTLWNQMADVDAYCLHSSSGGQVSFPSDICDQFCPIPCLTPSLPSPTPWPPWGFFLGILLNKAFLHKFCLEFASREPGFRH